MPVPLWAKAIIIGVFVAAIIFALSRTRKSYQRGVRLGEKWKEKRDKEQK